MATLTITIPDAQLNRILNIYADAQGWMAVLDSGVPNPETKAQFLKRRVIEHIKGVVIGHERTTAEKAIATSADPGLT